MKKNIKRALCAVVVLGAVVSETVFGMQEVTFNLRPLRGKAFNCSVELPKEATNRQFMVQVRKCVQKQFPGAGGFKIILEGNPILENDELIDVKKIYNAATVHLIFDDRSKVVFEKRSNRKKSVTRRAVAYAAAGVLGTVAVLGLLYKFFK